MPLILCHSPKGGVGTSFIAAQMAIHLAKRGHEVSAIDLTYQDALKLYFGLLPSQALPPLGATGADAVAVAGVQLYSGYELAQDAAFREGLAAGAEAFGGDTLYIVDVAAGDREMRDLLMPHAALHLCTLQPRPGALAVLSKIAADGPTVDLPKTVFVLNHLDDTHRLSRHSHIFLRELFGDKLLGTVRRDEAVNEAAAMFEGLAKFAPASVALADLEKLAEAVEARCGLGTRVEGLA